MSSAVMTLPPPLPNGGPAQFTPDRPKKSAENAEGALNVTLARERMTSDKALKPRTLQKGLTIGGGT